jgi:uncharacterized phiE125 gp8 family phage protein
MTGVAEQIVTMSEAQAYVRIDTGEEEALLAGLIRTASGLCEAFINQVVVARPFECELPASGRWERLPITPVRSMSDVAAIDTNGVATPLDTTSYTLDIDFAGDGWVRVAQASASRIRVSGTAGIADCNCATFHAQPLNQAAGSNSARAATRGFKPASRVSTTR